jgi:hypothetical protein
MWSLKGYGAPQGWRRPISTSGGEDPGGGTPGATSYVTGNRLGSIAVTATVDTLNGDPPALVDGSFVQDQSGTPPYGSTYFVDADCSVMRIIFDFGAPRVVDEAKWYQNYSGEGGQGQWQWYGSVDGVTLTAALGGNFELGAGSYYNSDTDFAPQVQTTLNGNTTAYRYYILAGVSGVATGGPWVIEIEFKQSS